MANQSPAAGKQKRHEQTDQLDIEKSTTPNFSTSVLMGDSAMVALFGCERVPKSGCRTSESASRNASKRPRGRKRVTCAGSLYENSLVLAMGAVFLATWLTQSVNGWRAFNARQQSHDEPSISWASYVRNPDFWNRTLQNWQSEFLAVGTMAVFTIYLRQRGSPESKPVGAPQRYGLIWLGFRPPARVEEPARRCTVSLIRFQTRSSISCRVRPPMTNCLASSAPASLRSIRSTWLSRRCATTTMIG
jgi:hypothetical protein